MTPRAMIGRKYPVNFWQLEPNQCANATMIYGYIMYDRTPANDNRKTDIDPIFMCNFWGGDE